MLSLSRSSILRLARTTIYAGLGLFFFLIPGITLIGDLNDPGLKNGDIPREAWRLHERLASRYADWANARLDSDRGQKNGPDNVSGTEWPLFGSVFYLWSMESLQKAWEADHSLAKVSPAEYARDAIYSAADLVTDPNQAGWVKKYWGDDYLYRQDLFYRFLLISAMTSYTNLTGNDRFIKKLRHQVDTLSEEIASSPHGLVEDYPGQCYPTDIVGAITAIRRADEALKTDHSAFVAGALHAFLLPQADSHDLPPYMANARTGVPQGESRGCGNSFALICAPEIWLVPGHDWYHSYTENFWQERWGLVGFREYAKDTPVGRAMADVDSGPIILGYGFAASAFGTGAARANGRMDQAGPLAAEMLVSSWPLANGRLLIPRLLSNAVDAPYLGETGILYCLTREPVAGIEVQCSSVITPFVFGAMVLYLGFGTLLMLPLVEAIRDCRRLQVALVKREAFIQEEMAKSPSNPVQSAQDDKS